jgi:methionyl-tRNA formyltransferase
MRLVFAGTPVFAQTALAALHGGGHDIALVLTQPDRPAGRGMQLQASAVKQYALQHGMALCQPTSLRLDGKYPDEADAAQAAIAQAQAEAMVVVAYGFDLASMGIEKCAPGLPQYPRLAVAALARCSTHSTRHRSGRRREWRVHHAHGRGLGHRAGADGARALSLSATPTPAPACTTNSLRWASRLIVDTLVSNCRNCKRRGASHRRRYLRRQNFDKDEALIDWHFACTAFVATHSCIRSVPRRAYFVRWTGTLKIWSGLPVPSTQTCDQSPGSVLQACIQMPSMSPAARACCVLHRRCNAGRQAHQRFAEFLHSQTLMVGMVLGKPRLKTSRMFFDPANFRHPAFRQGMVDTLKVAPGIWAWGLMTGVDHGASRFEPVRWPP